MPKTKEEILEHYGLGDHVVEYKGMTDEAEGVLAQYGILGMKWGVRRDRRTLDRISGRKAGKPRPNKAEQDKARLERRTEDQGARTSRRSARQAKRTLSDDDIKSRINRLKLEKELTKLTNEDLRPIRTKLAETLSKAGWDVAGNVSKTGFTVLARMALEGKAIPRDEIAKYLKPK